MSIGLVDFNAITRLTLERQLPKMVKELTKRQWWDVLLRAKRISNLLRKRRV